MSNDYDILLGSLNFTQQNTDQLIFTTVDGNGSNNGRYTRIFLEDATAEYVRTGNASQERGEFKNTDDDPNVNPGGLEAILDVSANAIGNGGLNDSVAYFFIAEDKSGGIDLYSVDAEGQNTDLLANNVISIGAQEQFTDEGGFFIEMLNETERNADGLIAYAVEDGSKTEARFIRILTDDDTMEFASVGGTATNRGEFNNTGGLDEIVALSANAIGTDGFNAEQAYMMLVTDDEDQYDLFSVDISGKVTGVLAQNVLAESYGTFDVDAPSTKMAMLNETVKNTDGLIVQLGEDNRQGSTQEQLIFTRILTDDDTGEFAFMGGNSKTKFAQTDTGRTRIDIEEILAFEATPLGATGRLNRDEAYTLTARDEQGNVDIYGVDISGQTVTLLEDNVFVA